MKTTFTSIRMAYAMGISVMALAMTSPMIAYAQVTTSDVQGSVTDDNNMPITNAMIRITNTATGLERNIRANALGAFSVRNLPIAGAYDIEVIAEGYQGERVESIVLSLSDEANLTFTLNAITDELRIEEITVVAKTQVLADVAVGPSAVFGAAILEDAPAINRNIADVIRIDPRVYIDESRGSINSVQCVGQSSRFNSITLDGVAINDSFGLNSNGYPTERMPFPYDALDQVSVEIAPFDVKYGGFTACNINSVTKSGTNDISGSTFFDYTDNNLRSDKIEDDELNFDPYDEIRYGFTLGGPIVKDKFFYFLAYEKLEGANTFSTNALGNGFRQVTQSELDEIVDIAQTVYQYDPGNIPTSFPNEDEKILLKLDWNINSQHRAAFTYNYNDGLNIVRSDEDSDELEFSNHLYERGAELESYVGALYSDWNDELSTELRVGYLKLDNRQLSLGGTDFGEFQIQSAQGATVYIGSDDSRQSNDLNYDLLDISLRASYDMGNHQISGGIEHKSLDLFNLFIQHSQTETRFTSIDNFRNGIASEIYYNNAPSHNPQDAAADWAYALNTLYIQDDFKWGDLNIVAGLRYDWYTSDDTPVENPAFTAEYGFSNAQNFDGFSLLQPRIGFTWDATNTLQIRGGIGIYSGGNPNVWLSNNYSSTNVTQVGDRLRDRTNGIDLFSLTYTGAEDGVPNAPGWAVPQSMYDAVSTGFGRNFEINYLDPDFEIPSDWKFSIGASWAPYFDIDHPVLGGEWQFELDFLTSQSENTAIILRGDLVQNGTQIIDGVTYPTYTSPNQDSFILTNANISNESFVASIGTIKSWDNGMRMTLGYAYSDAKDVQPMTSSVAFSNYNNRAFIDPQEQVLSTSNYNVKHRFIASFSYTKDFWSGYDTNIYTYLQSSSGRPYSRVQAGDPNDIYGFTPFLGNESLLQPGTERNEFTGPAWTKVDFRISQELPGFRKGDNASVFLVIDNLTNLLNSEWGVLKQPSFPRPLVPGQNFSRSTDASAYEIRIGAKYEF